MRTLGATIATLLVVTAGCGTDGRPASKATPTPSPEPAKNQRYSTVVELRDAAIEAGYPCPRWKQDNRVTLAAESGTCTKGGADVLSTFSSEGNLQEQLETYRGLDEMMRESNLESDPRLVGPNWIINSPRAAALAGALGGTVESP